MQFGNAPITSMVNMQWKREALEKHNAERLTCSPVNREKLLSEYVAGRQSRQNVDSRPKRKSKATIKWKRPLCMQKEKDTSAKTSK